MSFSNYISPPLSNPISTFPPLPLLPFSIAAHHEGEVNRGGRGRGYGRRRTRESEKTAGSSDGEKLVARHRRELAAAIYLRNDFRPNEKTGGTSFPNISTRVDRFHVNYTGECAVEFVRAGSGAGGEGSFKAAVNLSPDSVYTRVIFH